MSLYKIDCLHNCLPAFWKSNFLDARIFGDFDLFHFKFPTKQRHFIHHKSDAMPKCVRVRSMYVNSVTTDFI